MTVKQLPSITTVGLKALTPRTDPANTHLVSVHVNGACRYCQGGFS